MASHGLQQQLVIMPVGWGFSALHTIDYGDSVATVITDGGSLPTCYTHVVNMQRHLAYELDYTLKHSDLIIWIISHFDYDHISLVTQRLNAINKSANICILPFTYSEPICREALALYLALIAYELGQPSLPEILQSVLSRCYTNVFAKKGFKLRIDSDVYYEFLWPSPTHISSARTCNRVQEELKRRISERCRRDKDGCRNLEELLTNIEKKLSQIGDAEQVNELDIKAILSQGDRARKRSNEGSTSLRSVEILPPEDAVSREHHFSRILELYNIRETKKNLENVYSLAYIVRSSHPHKEHLEVYTEGKGPLRMRHNSSLSIGISDKVLNNVLIYLGDLDDSSIGQALEGYTPIQVLILIPAHHGNSWHREMLRVRALLTYLNRCHDHVPVSFKRRLRLRYLTRGISDFALIGDHMHEVLYT